MIADVNHDGKMDVVAFGLHRPSDMKWAWRLAFGDVNHDGKTDVITSNVESDV